MQVKSIQLNSPDGELNVLCTLNYFVAKLTCGQLYGEFNLAVLKKQFSYGTKWNNLALQLVAKFS